MLTQLLGMFGLIVVLAGPGHKEVAFKMHVINADSPYEAASVLDVNRDGKLDIMCSKYWYEAPKWTKHFVRKMRRKEDISQDFANVPLDVDGDNWTDIITGAWHIKRIFWVRNPGKSGDKFDQITIDKPGPVETIVLHDITGDGLLDLLPDIDKGIVWYEFKRDPLAEYKVIWKKHKLPRKADGHGIGAGDVNGDGRCDIIVPRGWFEQPTDLNAKWIWHQDFNLGHASIPILLHDVDGDGDGDIIWGMGHNYGVYWLDQGRNALGQRVWYRHEIDHDWSQAHFVTLGDLDGDGQDELVTGKRYRAHNGRDPGSDDPCCIYYYHFEPEKYKWHRHTIHEGGKPALGINTQLADIDGDGDLDLVAPGKSGLFLFENLRKK